MEAPLALRFSVFRKPDFGGVHECCAAFDAPNGITIDADIQTGRSWMLISSFCVLFPLKQWSAGEDSSFENPNNMKLADRYCVHEK